MEDKKIEVAIERLKEDVEKMIKMLDEGLNRQSAKILKESLADAVKRAKDAHVPLYDIGEIINKAHSD